jgi:hypothetical protein
MTNSTSKHTRRQIASLFMAVAMLGAKSSIAKGGSPAPAPAPAAAPALKAVTLTFDDFVASPATQVPAGYGGFIWGDRWWALQDPAATNNYLALASGASLWIMRADRSAFYFDGADFWSRRGLDAVGDFYYVLYYQGQTVYNGLTAKKGKNVFTSTPTLIAPAYTGPVDGVAFAFDSNGTDWNHLAMDNFRIRVPA